MQRKKPPARYQKEDLGTCVTFLLPSLKLKNRSRRGETLEAKLHHFLLQNFSGYTAAAGNVFGYWRSRRGKEFYGEHTEYKVSLLDSGKLETLEGFLAELALEMDEDSLYLAAGKESWLLYPEK